MSHPDEGLIHTWLDGELDAAEAARVEALVRDDPAWAAAAAEARGFIAASARIVGKLDDVPADVLPRPAVARGTGAQRAAGHGSANVAAFRRASSRGTPWWAMRVAALLVVATGTVLVVRRVTPDDAARIGDQVAKQAAAELAAPAPPVTPPATSPAAPLATAATAAAAAPAALREPEKSVAAGARPPELKDRRLNDAPVATNALRSQNEADAVRRPAQTSVADAKSSVQSAQAGAPAQQQGVQTLQAPSVQPTQTAQSPRRDLTEVGKVQGADEKRLAAADASRDAASLRGGAAGTGGAATGSLKKEDLPASPKLSAPRASAAAGPPPDQFRQQVVGAVSREECYREGVEALDAAPVVHRVGRTSDSTAMPSAALGLRAQTNTLRARESSLSTTMRVRGDTLFIGIVNGVARIALRVNCPAP